MARYLDVDPDSLTVEVSESELATVFTEWLRRYEENPESFTEEFGNGVEYGTDCARYLIKLLLGGLE